MSVVDHARVSRVARFDTVSFNQETHHLQVWRYPEGLYSGHHDLVLSVRTELIKRDLDFVEAVRLIGMVAGLFNVSEENNLPTPWKGYRFI